MNKNKRNRNRELARQLEWNSHVCPECGQRGKHWVQTPYSLEEMLMGAQPAGFWTCDKFYDENGRRKI